MSAFGIDKAVELAGSARQDMILSVSIHKSNSDADRASDPTKPFAVWRNNGGRPSCIYPQGWNVGLGSSGKAFGEC
jgi:hypothetical protein